MHGKSYGLVQTRGGYFAKRNLHIRDKVLRNCLVVTKHPNGVMSVYTNFVHFPIFLRQNFYYTSTTSKA